jgi:DNA-directed RNA polymerase specialized sigma24 family protein
MTNLSNTDPELIQVTIAGDQITFKTFVERYQNPIFSYLYSFLYQNMEAADDVTQTVFLKVYQNLKALMCSSRLNHGYIILHTM